MTIIFDPAKDAANLAKHGISLSLAVRMTIDAVRIDNRKDYGETRYIALGRIGAQSYCLVFADQDGMIRAISLRRAHAKEFRRHVQTDRV